MNPKDWLAIPVGLLVFACTFTLAGHLSACAPCDNACDDMDTDIEMGVYNVTSLGQTTLSLDSVEVQETAVTLHMTNGDQLVWTVTDTIEP